MPLTWTFASALAVVGFSFTVEEANGTLSAYDVTAAEKVGLSVQAGVARRRDSAECERVNAHPLAVRIERGVLPHNPQHRIWNPRRVQAKIRHALGGLICGLSAVQWGKRADGERGAQRIDRRES